MQKQFLANTEDAIQSPVDLPSQITRYQNALKYARTKVDYVFGLGLYMAPSNMELRIGTIQGYNNKIILSTHDQKLWWNATVNLSADATSYSERNHNQEINPGGPDGLIKTTKTQHSHGCPG